MKIFTYTRVRLRYYTQESVLHFWDTEKPIDPVEAQKIVKIIEDGILDKTTGFIKEDGVLRVPLGKVSLSPKLCPNGLFITSTEILDSSKLREGCTHFNIVLSPDCDTCDPCGKLGIAPVGKFDTGESAKNMLEKVSGFKYVPPSMLSSNEGFHATYSSELIFNYDKYLNRKEEFSQRGKQAHQTKVFMKNECSKCYFGKMCNLAEKRNQHLCKTDYNTPPENHFISEMDFIDRRISQVNNLSKEEIRLYSKLAHFGQVALKDGRNRSQVLHGFPNTAGEPVIVKTYYPYHMYRVTEAELDDLLRKNGCSNLTHPIMPKEVLAKYLVCKNHRDSGRVTIYHHSNVITGVSWDSKTDEFKLHTANSWNAYTTPFNDFRDVKQAIHIPYLT